MKSIIFGISGQDGFYLSSLLEKNGIEVIGSSRTQGVKGDIGNFKFVQNLISEYKPDFIFHLAADSSYSELFLTLCCLGHGNELHNTFTCNITIVVTTPCIVLCLSV